MKNLFTFRQKPNESLTHRGLNGGRTGVERTTNKLTSPLLRGLGGSTVHRALSTVNRVATLLCLLALSFGFSSQAWGAANRRVYCKMAQSWWTTDNAAVGVHYWGGSSSTTWPGVRMTSAGNNIWYCDIPDNSTGFQFVRVNGSGSISDWGAKTKNLAFDGTNNFYTISNTTGCWSNDCTCDGSWSKYAPNGAILGSMNSWDPTTNQFSSGSVTITLAANTTYEFKVLYGSDYYGNNSAITSSISNWGFATNTNDNCHLTTAVAGDYTFTWDNSNKKLSVTYPAITHPSADYYYVKNVANWSQVNAHLFTGETVIDNWPGFLPSSTTMGDETYYYFAAGAETTVIFSNNGSNQTSNQTLSGNKGSKYYNNSTNNWEKFQTAITIDKNGGETDGSTTVSLGSGSCTVTQPPTRTGYDNKGYYKEKGCSNYIMTASGSLQKGTDFTDSNGKWTYGGSTLTLHTKWEAKKCTLTLDQTGATKESTYKQKVIAYDETVPSLNNGYVPSRDYYDFAGYWTSDGTDGDWGSMLLSSTHEWQEVTGYTATVNSNLVWKRDGGATVYPKWTPTEYTYTFEQNGGSGATNGTYTYESDAITLPTASEMSKTGYTFEGWYTEAEFTNRVTQIPAQSNGNKKFFAKWTPIVTTVTVNMNGGNNKNQEMTETYDAEFDISSLDQTKFTRTGYDFKGLYTAQMGGSYLVNENWEKRSSSAVTGWLNGGATAKWVNPNTEATIFAQWQAHTWTITLNDNGGADGSGTKTATYGNHEGIVNVIVPTRANHSFAGYYSDQAGEGVQVYDVNGALVANATGYTDASRNWIYDNNVTLYAKWNSVGNYVVTLDNLSATTAGTTSVNVQINTTTGLTTITCPTKTGYTFGGYFTEAQGKGTQLIDAEGSWVKPAEGYIDNDGKWIKNENVTLKAKWIAKNYTVTLDNQEATTAGTESVQVTYNSTSNLTTAITVPTKTGYLFGGYFTEQDGNGSQLINADGTWIKDVTSYTGTYTNNPTWIYANNCTLYAKWTFIDYTVNFVVEPVVGGSIAKPILSDGKYTTAHYNVPFDIEAQENTGYHFVNWTSTSDINLGVTNGDIHSPARKLANDGPELQTSSSQLASNAVLVDVNGDKQITANFTPITYTITYNGVEDGDVNDNPATYTIETATITLQDASRTDYTFDGWYNAETGGNKVTEIVLGSTGDMVLWARWHETLHSVNIVESTGIESVSPTGATNVGNVTPVTITATVKAGYTWKNWTTDHDSRITFGNANDNPTTLKATESTNVYAHATENMTTITINANQTTWGKLQIGSTEQQWGSTRDAGVTTTHNLMAKPNTGYKFKEWQVTEGEGNVQITNAQSASTTVNGTGTANSTATIQAIFEEDLSTPWRLNYGVDGQSGWQQPNFVKRTGESTGKIAYVSVELTGGTTYHFNYVTGESTYKGPENDHAEMPANTEWTFDHAQRAKFIAGVSGTYTFKIDYSGTNPKASYETPSTSGIKGDWTNWAHEDGTVVDNVLTYTHTFNATGEQKFKVVFNGVFYGQENEGGRMTRQNHENWTLTSTNGGKDIYLNVDMVGEYIFTYNSTTNKLSVTYPSETMIPVTVYLNGETASTVEVGEATHPTIEAPQYVNGKRFAGWQADDGVTLVNASARSTQITAVTGTDKSVRATYNSNYMVYFKNTPGWDNVYVFFYTVDKHWKDNGTGVKYYDDNEKKWVQIATGHHMTRLNDKSDIWYYDYSGVSDVHGAIAFNDQEQYDYEYFASCQAAYRTDWDRGHNLSVFVPEKNISEKKNNNTTAYYNKGYWMKYNDLQTGYYLRVNGKSGDYEFAAASNGEPYKTTITLEGTQTYNFNINGCNGSYYRNNGEMTSSGSHSGWDFYEGVNDNCRITTSAAGNYTFTLTFGDGILYVSVEYPLSQDDYRVVYTDDSHPCHPSTFIRKNNEAKDTVSFFIDKDKNPALKFQYCSNISGSTVTWADVDGGTIDISSITETGIYNFYLEQTSTSISCTGHELYTGNFYIRTNVAAGGWDAYKGAADNLLPYIEYGLDQSQPFKFTHAYTNWVEANNNVKFCIANDYSLCISDSLVEDDILSNDWLGEKGANIRFMWNSQTNELKRAYLSGSTFSEDRFLVLTGDDKLYDKDGNAFTEGGTGREGLFANETILEDKGNWVYQIDIQTKPSARGKLTAAYNNHVQYFKGSEGDFAPETTEEIIGGTTSDTRYGIRLVYDFKTNRMVAGWMPAKTSMPIQEQMAIFADVIIIRNAQEAASQITFSGSGKLSDVKTVYGAIEFSKEEMVGKMSSWTETTYKNCMYYISFPFDVKVSEIFGLGTYGDTWLLQYYDGAERARKGWFAETKTFWKDVDFNDTLKANVGYSFLIDRVAFNDGNSTIWKNTANDASVYVYFPSIKEVSGIQQAESLEVTVPEHECKINRTFTVDSRELSHTFTDSHWNMMGVPVFQDVNGSTYSDIFIAEEDDATPQFGYLYAWNPSNNSLHIQNVNDNTFNFKAMHSYMVQYAGDITWTGSTVTPAEIAARRLDNEKNYNIDLQLHRNNAHVARTYVELREGADADFVLNEDVYMITNSAAGNIYSFAGAYDVAANVLPEENTTVNLGVIANQAGEFTFTMPSNFSGTATLIDREANTRTDLQLTDYTVNLAKGTYNNRFALELNIDRKISTDFNGADYKGNKPEIFKFIRNNQLLIMKHGVIYNACGNVNNK